jgi:hypothetical protein
MSKCNYYTKMNKNQIQIQPSSPVPSVVSKFYQTNGLFSCLGECNKTIYCNMVSFSLEYNQCIHYNSINGFIDAINSNTLTNSSVTFYKRTCKN